MAVFHTAQQRLMGANRVAPIMHNCIIVHHMEARTTHSSAYRVDCRHVYSRPGLAIQQVEQRPRTDALEAEEGWMLLEASYQRAGEI